VKKIRVTVSPGGKVEAEAEGFKGASCKEATEFLERALGKPSGESLKPEYFEQEAEEWRTNTTS
jgi:hypothetical protein